jgi:hypothetical protein
MTTNISDQVHTRGGTEVKVDVSHEEVLDIELDEAQKHRLKWKLDLFILPLISSVYFFGSMVREKRLITTAPKAHDL